MTLIKEYEDLVKKNPELNLANDYTIGGFVESGDRKIVKHFYRAHPMGGYQGGSHYRIGCSAYITFMPRKKVYRAKWSEQDCGCTSGEKDYKTLKSALKFVLPTFSGMIGYFGGQYKK